MADVVENFANYRIRAIEVAEAEYYEQLIQTLDKIEREVVSLVNKNIPLDNEGKLFQLRSAIAVQPLIRQVLEKEYLAWSDTVVRQGYNKQAKRIEKAFRTIGNIPTEFQQLTESDLILIQNLKRQSFTQFKDISNTFTRNLSQKVYQYTLINADPVDLEKELRQTINGIYASADDKEINKLVKSIKEDDVKYRKLDKRTVTGKALRQKLDKNIAILRHCALVRSGSYDKRASGLFTIDEVRKLWRSRSWSGKQSGDPLIVRGGYNCRHQWSYVNPDWYDKAGNLIIE